MRIKDGFRVRDIAGEYVIVAQGVAGVDFTKIISLNSSAKLLFEALAGRDFSVEDAAAVLMEKYGIGQELAMTDAAKWAEDLTRAAIIG